MCLRIWFARFLQNFHLWNVLNALRFHIANSCALHWRANVNCCKLLSRLLFLTSTLTFNKHLFHTVFLYMYVYLQMFMRTDGRQPYSCGLKAIGSKRHVFLAWLSSCWPFCMFYCIALFYCVLHRRPIAAPSLLGSASYLHSIMLP